MMASSAASDGRFDAFGRGQSSREGGYGENFDSTTGNGGFEIRVPVKDRTPRMIRKSVKRFSGRIMRN
ncbi:hypothetical protein [Bradyrhizobium sp.]|uniref:hypothetical protein n=1 Tax=Bradyrhizobium sp. TaxID=376 RepID=UPI002392895D|nr:hypothetical protein [Bradyrhizobium sp.]MDE2380403.1 hypothetical protein [Bradyrhizobium sp.]